MQQQVQKNWWGRNWKWVVPVGCLTVAVLVVAVIALVVVAALGMMKSTDAYKQAMAQARAHPQVQEQLGQPIEAGLFVTGNINISGGSGDADLAIPVSGPKGQGTLYVVAKRTAGQWTITKLELQLDTGMRLDIVDGPQLFSRSLRL